MRILWKVLILISIDILLFYKFGFWPGIIGLPFIIWKILDIFGITRKITFSRGTFTTGMVFLKDYQGPYFKNKEAFAEAANLIKSFKLKDYIIIGIYYDRPGEVDESKLRYSIGIYKKNLDKPDSSLESYCNSKDYYYAELPDSNCLYSSWDYSNLFAMMLGISKFNFGLKQKLKDADFKKTFRIKDTDCKIIVELYDNNSSIRFFAPLTNVEQFQLYKKDK